MEYQVVVEYDPSTRHYTASVAGIPSIIVDARSERTVLRLAAEAIALYLEERGTRRPRLPPRQAGHGPGL